MKIDLMMIVLTAALVLPAGYLMAGPARGSEIARPSVPDTDITAQIKTALLKEPGLETAALVIKTREGSVHLAGLVESNEKMNLAEDITSRVAGVRDVRSYIRIAAN